MIYRDWTITAEFCRYAMHDLNEDGSLGVVISDGYDDHISMYLYTDGRHSCEMATDDVNDVKLDIDRRMEEVA